MKKPFTVSGLVGSGSVQDSSKSISILPKFKNQSDFSDITTLNIALSTIEPNPYQPRRIFPQTEINELAISISEVGLIQPIAVRKSSNNTYQIIAGERRFKAFQLLERTEIPCFVFACDDGEMAIMAIAENVNREDLSDYEISKAIRSVETFFPNKTKLSEAVGLQREDMYRYFSFDLLPDFLIEKLNINPRLLSRNAAADIKRVLNKTSPEYLDFAISSLHIAIDLLEKKEIDQTKIAQYLTLSIKNSMLGINESIKKKDEFLIKGKKIGFFSSSPNGIVIKFSNGVLNNEKTQELQSLINNFLNQLFQS